MPLKATCRPSAAGGADRARLNRRDRAAAGYDQFGPPGLVVLESSVLMSLLQVSAIGRRLTRPPVACTFRPSSTDRAVAGPCESRGLHSINDYNRFNFLSHARDNVRLRGVRCLIIEADQCWKIRSTRSCSNGGTGTQEAGSQISLRKRTRPLFPRAAGPARPRASFYASFVIRD